MYADLDLARLRELAREIFDHGLRAVDARDAVQAAVSLEGSRLKISTTLYDFAVENIHVVAAGKAAVAMAFGLTEVLGTRIKSGVLTGPWSEDRIGLDSRWQLFRGGHPLPNEDSLRAAQAVFDLLHTANEERATVIFLISGGGSAMLEWPVNDQITLEALQNSNHVLVASGANIGEINSVRRAFSAVKGGRLATRAPLANQLTLIVSDTNPGDETSVASGPSLDPGVEAPAANEVLDRYNLRASLPTSIVAAVEGYRPDKVFGGRGARGSHVLLSNEDALKAAAAKARELGFATEVAFDIREQPIEQGCRTLLTRMQALMEVTSREKGVCLISGGEFSCHVRGDGVGGRNLETVLRYAMELDESQSKLMPGKHHVVLSAGTDGVDGNSPAAGAIADQTTISRGRERGLDVKSFLERSDSFHFFSQLGEFITTGPTGTNVRDLRIILGSR